MSGADAGENIEQPQIKIEGTDLAAVIDADLSSEQLPVKTESTLSILDKDGVKDA
jgi:hypothetical protein